MGGIPAIKELLDELKPSSETTSAFVLFSK
jgi:hypothetical protein